MFSTLTKLSVCLILVVLVLFIIELGCRFLEPGPIRLKDASPYIPDASLGQLHQSNFNGSWRGTHYQTNARGYRGPAHIDDSTPGLFRVLCVGDSLTYGAGVTDADSWPRLLEEHLAARLPEHEVQVINFGVAGWNSQHFLEAWRRYGVDLVPDLVILGWSLNDLPGAAPLLEDAPFPEPTPSPALLAHIPRTALARHFRAEWRHRGREERWAELQVSLDAALEPWRHGGAADLRTQVATLVTEIRASGAEPVILCHPYEFQVRSADADRSPERSLQMICKGLNTPYLPVARAFRSYLAKSPKLHPALYLRGDLCHLNAEGHELIAEQLFLTLERAALIP